MLFRLKEFTFLCSLIIFLSKIETVLSGTIKPSGTIPIFVSISNRNQFADYTFTFILDTSVPEGGTLRVTFPSQYSFGLGLVNPRCTFPCRLSAFTVTLTFTNQILAGVVNTIVIYSVRNPVNKGGTGNFQLSTYKGNNLLDQSLIFGVIGISDNIGTLTSTGVALNPSGSLRAGEVSRYDLTFKTTQVIPGGSYMIFTVNDDGFTLSQNPSCTAFSVNNFKISGKLFCQTEGRNIYIYGLSSLIPANQGVGISISMTNPKYSGTTQTFDISLLRANTTAVYDRRIGISGIPITAGSISNIALYPSVEGSVQSRGKVMDYILTFLPKNSMPLGAVITIQFPTTFTILTGVNAMFYVVSGLDDISEQSPVGLSLSGTILTISNFKAIDTPKLITLFLRMTNPSNVGQTTPFQIRTFTNSLRTRLIDQDITTAFTNIDQSTSGVNHYFTTPTFFTNTLCGTLEVLIVPTVSVPPRGFITINIPSTFIVSGQSVSRCRVRPFGQGYTNSLSCSRIDNLITIQLTSTQGMPLGLNNFFALYNVITTPSMNGTYLFDISTYDATRTIIESWNDVLTVNPPAFPTFSVTNLCQGYSMRTIWNFYFIPQYTIPASITQTSALDIKGFIELEFFNALTPALGTGATAARTRIPCRSAAVSGTIMCYIFPGNPVVIRVENFQEVAPGTAVSIDFPRIVNPGSGSAITVRIKTISLYNRIRTQWNSVQTTFPVAARITPNESNPVPNSLYNFSSPIIGTITNLVFNPGTSTTIFGPGMFIIEMPFYDIGWVPASNTIACKLGSVAFPCTRYDGADWIVIPLRQGQIFLSGTTITLENLQYPRFAQANIFVWVRFISTLNFQEFVNRTQSFIPTPTIPSFAYSSLLVDKKADTMVNSKYTFTFSPINLIPRGAIILITFPSFYNLLSSYPPLQFSSPDLVGISASQPLTFTPGVNTLRISNFLDLPSFTTFTIIVSGLKNPSLISIAQPFKAEVFLNSNLMVFCDNFDRFAFTSVLSSGTITFNSITAFPSNAGLRATYTISFIPATEIPEGGIIRITFPSTGYTSLPSNPVCGVSGGITTLAACKLIGNTYFIELDTDYTTGSILITIDNILNPSATTSGFVVKTFYDGVFLDVTDTSSLLGRTVTITPASSPISVRSITFDPRNEGEISNYIFTFIPTSSLSSSMQIIIIFPSVYDNILGNNIECTPLRGISGDLSCVVINRILTISGFGTYVPNSDNPVSIQVYGVVNPNLDITTNTGHFTIATIVRNSLFYKDCNPAAGFLFMDAAPGWSTLFNVSATNLFTRVSADYTFNFTASALIPATSSGGSIIVEYPSQFDLENGKGTCDTKNDKFATTLSCSIVNNKVKITGHPASYSGNLVFFIRSIVNPTDPGTAGNIILKTYDGLRRSVIERSYTNLDPFSFTYKYPGPLISVNGDQPIRVEIGTSSSQIAISLEYPCALNLTFEPSAPGFSVFPTQIPLKLGMNKANFRVSVPQNFPGGTYYITWTTKNELSSPYYTPIKKTQVIISSSQKLVINVPSVFEIPYGGNSLFSFFSVPFGPDVGFEVTLSFLSTYPSISLDTTSVIFRSGQTRSAFMVQSSNTTDSVKVKSGTILLSLSGVNKDVYTLSATSISFQVIGAMTIPPDITELSVSSITQTSATVQIGTSAICMAYYMLALDGTVTPDYEMVISQGPAEFTSTRSIFGYVQIGTSNLASVTFNNLVAQTPYKIFVYVVDRQGNTNDPKSKSFVTLDRFVAANLKMQFTQSFLNTAERRVIVETVAFVLSLPTSKVEEKKYNIGRRMLESNFTILEEEEEPRNLQRSTTSTIDLQIITTPESSIYPSPVELANLLNSRQEQLSARLTNFDTTYTIVGTPFPAYRPFFAEPPIIIGYSYWWGAFSGKLSSYGWLFLVLVEASKDFGKPTPYQIWNGLESRNMPVANGFVEVSEPYIDFPINVTNILPATEYNVYIIGGSAHPGYPDLMTSSQIVTLTFTTNPAPIIPKLDINHSGNIALSWTLLFVVIAFMMLNSL